MQRKLPRVTKGEVVGDARQGCARLLRLRAVSARRFEALSPPEQRIADGGGLVEHALVARGDVGQLGLPRDASVVAAQLQPRRQREAIADALELNLLRVRTWHTQPQAAAKLEQSSRRRVKAYVCDGMNALHFPCTGTATGYRRHFAQLHVEARLIQSSSVLGELTRIVMQYSERAELMENVHDTSTRAGVSCTMDTLGQFRGLV
eukprot:1900492-Pleurochrysis_carterae.AAC.2